MAVDQPKIPELQPSPSENEVLKEQEYDVVKAAHLTPLKPYVSERFDRPGKRILVNLTIATDDGSDSVYTLHVAVPTGGGSHNVEQVLTHENRLPDEDNNMGAINLGTCSSEPPPRMPDCPCSCLPPLNPTFLDTEDDDDHHTNENIKSLLASTTASPQTIVTSTATNSEFDNSITTTDTTDKDSDNDNVTDTDVRDGEKFACPDVMPILILEGDCTVCSHS